MKILAIVPDPRAAYALGDVLGALPRRSLRIVAYGQTTAAALPPGLDVLVYPVREGTRLPAPFVDALVQHEWPNVILAPAGAIRNATVPTLLIDLDPAAPVSELAPSEDDGQSGWLEAVTTDADRRRELLRAGVFSVELTPALLSGTGRVSAQAAPFVLARLADMAGLGGRSGGAAPEFEAAQGLAPATTTPPKLPVAPEAPGVCAPAERAAESDPLAVERPVPPAPRPPLAPPTSDLPPTMHPTHEPQRYKGRYPGGRVLVLAALSGLDSLTPADLSYSTVIATPEVMPWLNARMGMAHFVCAGAAPRTLEAASAVEGARTVLVHASHLDGAAIAPRARARVSVQDLSRAGGPALGWSDEMAVGFFPGPGDVALAVQWAAWLGPSEILVAGLDPLEAKPHWPAFHRGAAELLSGRGVRYELAGRPRPEAPPEARLARPAGKGFSGR